MDTSMLDLIRRRRSVRSFEDRPLTEEDKNALEAYVQAVSNPFGVPVRFRLLNAREAGLSSPVIVGEKAYLAAKVERVPNYEIAFGYSFEKACLFALSRGIGTVMLAATLNRSAFEKALELGQNEVMPVASPVGYPAGKMSVRESLMRKGTKADSRKAFESLFFKDGFEQGLSGEAAGIFYQPLEALRWAPSATNGQPWRGVLAGDTLHFYEARSMKDNSLGDIQKVDLGIGLSHFDLVRTEEGLEGGFVFEDPGIKAPEKTHYIVSFRRKP